METLPASESGGRQGQEAAKLLQLFVACSPDPAREHSILLIDDSLELGREGVSIADPRLSRRHCLVARDGDALTVRDLGSRNGVFVDGCRVEEASLQDQSILRVGDTVCVVSAVGTMRLHDEMIGVSAKLNALIESLDRAAPSEVSVLLLGASGTGKELAARYLHQASGRRGRLVALNCASLPRELVESTLFGHKKGAFTGAVNDAIGAFGEADEGTLFLDEIGDLPPEVQPKLLRVLESREYTPLGTGKPVRSSARIVAATNAHIVAEVAARTFRPELYARLSAFTVTLPSLAERRADIALISARFFSQIGADKALIRSAGFVEALLLQPWPLNVRELKNCIQELVLRHDGGDELSAKDVSDWAQRRPAAVALAEPQEGQKRTPAESRPGPTREVIEELLREHNGNVVAVAAALNCQRKQLYRLFDRHGISPAKFREPQT